MQKNMWKKCLALILIMCLIVGFTQDSRLFASTNAVTETTADAGTTEEQNTEEVEEDAQNTSTSDNSKEAEAIEETPQEETTAEDTQSQETEAEAVQSKTPSEPQETAQQNEEAPQSEEVPQGEESATAEEALPELGMETLTQLTANSASEYVNVKIYNNDVVTDGTIHTGFISENVAQTEGDSHFVGAYVVLENGKETQIAYIGTTTDANGNVSVYYAVSESSSTGTLLKEGDYIKLVYKTTCKITYEIRLDDGTLCEDGGTFYNKQESVDYGNNVRVQFKASKGNENVGDCTLTSISAVGADGTETPIEVDEDGYGYLNDIRQNVTICAKVSIVNQYKLVVDKQAGGHVCWAGHGDEVGSNTSDPYSVSPAKFCSRRVNDDGSVDTVTAAPGGTIYFVLYSQAWTGGGIWELKNLSINGKPLDPIYDGGEYTTDLGDGMIAHFRYLGAGKDSHLSGTGSLLTTAPKNKERCKYECWVENVSSDIHVSFESFDSTNHEILTLAEADGIDKIVASTFDRQAVGGDYLNLGKYNITRILPKVGHYDFWKDLLTPVSKVGDSISDITYTGQGGILANPDAPYAASFWGDWEYCWFYSKYAHVEVQSDVFVDSAAADANRETSEWGSRYIYFKTKAGYDPRTMNAQITGKEEGNSSGRIAVSEMGSIYDLRSDAIQTVVYSANNNRSMYLAKEQGYMWYLRYYGAGINSRNLYLNCDPYQFGVEYDLDGGTIDGSDTYTDSNTYTIESGKNKISLPNTNPTKDGYVFTGWKLVAVQPTNVETVNTEEYNPLDGVQTDYNTNDVFTISSSNYKAGLETEREEYDILVDNGDNTGYGTYHYVDYIPKADGNHRFIFVAQWADEDDPEAPKAEYTVKIYTETAPGTEDAVEVDGKTWLMEEKTYIGIKGEDIISIQKTPAGYVLDDEKSVTKLMNFMEDGHTEDEIVYYFRMPEWSLTQSTNPEGGETAEEAVKVKADNEIYYTLVIKNQENEKVTLPAGTVVTEVLPEGMGTPTSQKDGGLDFSYDESTRTVTYKVSSAMEVKAGESIVLQYVSKVEAGGLMESQAQMKADWKSYESEKSYHVTSADLTISNVLKGDYADYSKSFRVVITLTKADGEPLDDKRVSYVGGTLDVNGANNAPANGTAILNAQNQITIKLKHGQSVTLKDLPYGCIYSVLQEEESGYITSYGGVATGEYFQGTDIPIVTDIWPEADDFADEYELLTLTPSGIFEYDGKYYVICREFKLNREQAEPGPAGKGPGGQTNGWYGVTELTGKIVEMEKGAQNINGLTRGDIVKYGDDYYVYNTDGEWGCNPENDTANPPQYYKLPQAGSKSQLFTDTTVPIVNLCEKISPTGIEGVDPWHAGGIAAVAFGALVAAGYGIWRKKLKKVKNM